MASGSLRVGIVGVGNCASAFVQGLARYRESTAPEPGLPHPDLGGYRVADIVPSAAFDVAEGKVGADLAAAILAPPNNTAIFAEVPACGVPVRRGPTLDGLGRYLTGTVTESDAAVVDVADALRGTRTEVLVSWLPVGSEAATAFYAEAALAAGCAFVNCIPSFIASDPAWASRFAARGLPLIGDDIKSQVGATILHRTLVDLFRDRGVRLDRTYQLNFGGNTDFLNMLERDRLASKKLSKTRAVTSRMASAPRDADVHVGPSDFVPWLDDRKWAHIRLEGTAFGDQQLNIEVKLEVWDSPNSAGIVMDAVRCARIALDRGIGGPLEAPSAWFMKSPPRQMDDHGAREATLRFVAGR
ncbi:inositol-3-phosphate synthase [Falsiroseomonas bella]|uniref:Inositol-3-phosphate synthase n=1 Tax=Falsiroseomonas bella TaxID=2184016 RepID=A0A317FEP1_9PROT|nr:inositol-3-phosphate synthase [Falsiroseomonas bella]PWS37023.1 inositol-3-phosphate synthase [Falsiroseomonas bella]